MRLILALIKFALRLLATFGISALAFLAFTRLVPVPTALSLIRRISMSVGLYFLADLVATKVGAHVNKTVDEVAEAAGIHVAPHPLDKF